MTRSLPSPAILLFLFAAHAMTQCVPRERAGAIDVKGFPEVEQVWTDSIAAVRIALNFPGPGKGSLSPNPLLILYALPNGNSIEQTQGRKVHPGMDWHFGIQHIAAQTRYLRKLFPDRCIAVGYLEAVGLSWPRWRRERKDTGPIILGIVDSLRYATGAPDISVALSGHSGGGSFLFGFIDACDTIPGYVERICFLDSNYGFSDQEGHTAKIEYWLRNGGSRVLSVIAYDDREILLNGKRVVGPEGGTYRRTREMAHIFSRSITLDSLDQGPFIMYRGLNGRVEFCIHRNPDNEILHTRLVGEMNGFLHAMTLGSSAAIPIKGPEIYGAFIGE